MSEYVPLQEGARGGELTRKAIRRPHWYIHDQMKRRSPSLLGRSFCPSTAFARLGGVRTGRAAKRAGRRTQLELLYPFVLVVVILFLLGRRIRQVQQSVLERADGGAERREGFRCAAVHDRSGGCGGGGVGTEVWRWTGG